MFTAIAPRYDLLNHVLSLNIDRRWRRRAANLLREATCCLDLCAGTLDLTLELSRTAGFHGRIIAADFVLPMLRIGREKTPHLPVAAADALALPFPDRTFDGCMIGFGLRNLVDLDRGLGEIARVLKRGGRVVILEFSAPRMWPIRPLYFFYFRRVLPLVGRLVSKHTTAYRYLPDSVDRFPPPAMLAERMRHAGFADVRFESLSLGIAALHSGTRAA